MLRATATFVRAAVAPRRAFHSARALLAEPEPAAASASSSELRLTFALPSKSLVANKEVTRVTLPGREGVFAAEKNSPPSIAELAPGVVRVDFKDATTAEYFIPGGFSFKHANNSIDVSTIEGVKLDAIDVDAMRAANAEAVKKREAATPGSKEHAEAKIVTDLYRTVALSLKVSL